MMEHLVRIGLKFFVVDDEDPLFCHYTAYYGPASDHTTEGEDDYDCG